MVKLVVFFLISALVSLFSLELQAQSGECSRAIVFVLDMSASMGGIDASLDESEVLTALPPSRREIAQAGLSQFIDEAFFQPGDRLGLVVFGRESLVLVPLTSDSDELVGSIETIDQVQLDLDGAAIGDGVSRALSMLRESTCEEKAVVLLTDGNENAGTIDLNTAAEAAVEVGCTLHVLFLAVGEEVIVPTNSPFSDESYRVAPYTAAPGPFQSVAQITGGTFIEACTVDDASNSLDQMVGVEGDGGNETSYCQAARELLCDVCGTESLLCETCEDDYRLFCQAIPRRVGDDWPCKALVEEIERTADQGDVGRSLCDQGEEELLLDYNVPGACDLARQLACETCGALRCLVPGQVPDAAWGSRPWGSRPGGANSLA